MINAEILPNGSITVDEPIVSDSVKFEVIKFAFPSSWEGYTKTAIFRNGDIRVDIILNCDSSLCTGVDQCYVPFEVIKPLSFEVSVFGVKGEAVATTTNANITVIKSGYAENGGAVAPTPNQYQQLIALSLETKEIAQSVRNDADNGSFKGDKGDKGDDGEITNIDQSFNFESENAQSGIAVWEAINTKEVKAFLPKEIYCAVGRTIEIYNNQVCLNAEKYHFKWKCNTGAAFKRKCRFSASRPANYTLELYIYDDNLNELWSGRTTLKMVAAQTSSFNICCIGDDMTNGRAWLAELQRLNENLTFSGTLSGNATASGESSARQVRFEGRNGWSAAKYLTSGSMDNNTSQYKNPFYNPNNGRFDWNYYVTEKLGGVSPDAVQLFFGLYELNLDPVESAGNIKQIVDYIRLDNSNIPIYIVNTVYGPNQNGIAMQEATIVSGKNCQEERLKVFNLMTELYNALKNYDNLYFVPLALCHDSEYNYGKVERSVNPRSTETETVPSGSIYPQQQGYYQMADVIFSAISAYSI